MMSEDGVQALLGIVRGSIPRDVVAAWALASVVAAGALLLGWRRRYLDARIGASLLALGGVAGALLWSPLRQPAQVYKHVDEVITESETLRNELAQLQVHGTVVPGSILMRGSDEYRFQLESRPERPCAVLDVRYTGLVPETFFSGAEIVAKGTLDANGRLWVIPDGIIAKVPTMYPPLLEPERRARACLW